MEVASRKTLLAFGCQYFDLSQYLEYSPHNKLWQIIKHANFFVIHAAHPVHPERFSTRFLLWSDTNISSLVFRALQDEYERLKVVRAQDMNGNASSYSPSESNRDAELQAEAKVLRQHKGRLEARMQILEDHNKQLEAQLQRLRQLLEQVSRQYYSDDSCRSS